MTAVRRVWLVGVLALFAGGCSTGAPGAVPTQGVQHLAPPLSTPTPLATQAPEATTKPVATPKATPKPIATSKSTSFYKPPGWDGYSDVNCKDFDTHAHAQSFFKGTGGSTSNDPYGLDGDHDGIACETLP